MIRLVAVGLWACAVTVAAGYAALWWQYGRIPGIESTHLPGGLDTLTTRPVSVPIIADGAVQGYVVAQFAFTVEAALVKRLPIEPDLLLVDEAIRTIYAGNGLDFRQMTRQDLPALARTLAENANARLGARLVQEVLIQELNYVPKDQVRSCRSM
ncbi:MAG: hypothetical protein KJZ80_10510 [Hyphomicrobiaceae bacterium]|nr:hypothetical protein [Hyphomicrobiaceae bacterium]